MQVREKIAQMIKKMVGLAIKDNKEIFKMVMTGIYDTLITNASS